MANPKPTGMTDNHMWYITKEQAAQAAVVLIIYPDGVFGYTHNGVDSDGAGHLIRSVADKILDGAVAEARTDL